MVATNCKRAFFGAVLVHLLLGAVIWAPACNAAALDWRDKNVVGSAQDQGECAASWAFAATSVFESKIRIKGFSPVDLAPQQLISCSDKYAGCSSDGDRAVLKFWNNTGPMLASCTGYPSVDGSEPACEDFGACGKLPYRTTGYYTVGTAPVTNAQSSIANDGPAFLQFDCYGDFDTYWRNNDPGTVYTQASGEKQGVISVAVIGYNDTKAAWLCLYSAGATAGPNNDGTFWLAYDGHLNDLNMEMANVLLADVSIRETQPDLIINNASTGVNYIYYLDGYYKTGSVKIKSSLGWTIVGVGDFNGDGDSDIVFNKPDAGKTSVWLMDGVTFGSTEALNDVAVAWHPVAVADFDDDGDSDIFWRNVYTGKNVFWFMDGVAWEDLFITTSCNTNWSVRGTGDFNKDGIPDLFWRHASTGQNVIWHMNGDGSLADWAFTESAQLIWDAVAVNDFDGDGSPEILWRNATTGKNVVWTMDDTELSGWFFIEKLDASWNIAASGVFH